MLNYCFFFTKKLTKLTDGNVLFTNNWFLNRKTSSEANGHELCSQASGVIEALVFMVLSTQYASCVSFSVGIVPKKQKKKIVKKISLIAYAFYVISCW